MAKEQRNLSDEPPTKWSFTYRAVVNNGISVGISCNCSPRQMTVVPSQVQPFGHWTPHWALRAVWSYSIRSGGGREVIRWDAIKHSTLYFDIESDDRSTHRTFVWPSVLVPHSELHWFRSASHADRHSTIADDSRRWTDSERDVWKTASLLLLASIRASLTGFEYFSEVWMYRWPRFSADYRTAREDWAFPVPGRYHHERRRFYWHWVICVREEERRGSRLGLISGFRQRHSRHYDEPIGWWKLCLLTRVADAWIRDERRRMVNAQADCWRVY